MKVDQAVFRKLVATLLGGAFLAGCSSFAISDNGKGDKPSARSDVVLNLVLTGQGDLIAVDSFGNELKSCRLAVGKNDVSEDPNVRKSNLPICQGTTDTTITSIKSYTVITHTGSHCITFTTGSGGDQRTTTKCFP